MDRAVAMQSLADAERRSGAIVGLARAVVSQDYLGFFFQALGLGAAEQLSARRNALNADFTRDCETCRIRVWA